ncbi:hypothetical protein ACFQPA_06465 [Halomarina halobia]|uniref:Intracellular proteinase inhibitor BsuPI domain-containing protein n=1 Tax=Halomarina halobia TaxID=3033386 RepID=A0ABD6A638_9EURY|nr:hypothetical protein [Halomarina sp. PSR21]
MRRRTALGLGATTLAGVVTGCLSRPSGAGDGGDDDGTDDDTDGNGTDGDPSDAAERATVSLAGADDPPDLPVRHAVEVLDAEATDERPPQLRVTLTNEADHAVEVGEGRAVLFEYVGSSDRRLVLLPGPADRYEAIRSGCWTLAEPIAVTEEYRLLALAAGESILRDLGVWGAADRGGGGDADACLPTGEFRFESTYNVARDEERVIDDPEWEAAWGFTLRVE